MAEQNAPDPERPQPADVPKPVAPPWLEDLDEPAEKSSAPSGADPIDLGRGPVRVPPSVADLILPPPPALGDLKLPTLNGSRLRPSSQAELPRLPDLPADQPPPPTQLPKLQSSSSGDFILPTKSTSWPELVFPSKPPSQLEAKPPEPPKTEPLPPPEPATPITEPLDSKTVPLPPAPTPKTELLHTNTIPFASATPKTVPLHALTVPADDMPSPPVEDSLFLVQRDDFSGLSPLNPALRLPEPAPADARSAPNRCRNFARCWTNRRACRRRPIGGRSSTCACP